MQEIRVVKVNDKEVPVLLSDEKEALLAAKAAGGAIVGLWDGNGPGRDWGPAAFLVENPEDAGQAFLERVARRHLGLPWRICETKRLLIREICGDDFSEIRENQIGLGFLNEEEMESYTKNQYAFYGFGFWALLEKESGSLVGVAGFTAPREPRENGNLQCLVRRLAGSGPAGRADGETARRTDSGPAGRADGETARRMDSGPAGDEAAGRRPIDEGLAGRAVRNECGAELELGYHIFVPYRRRGFAREACLAILDYARAELDAELVCVRMAKDNAVSKKFAESIGFR